MTSERSIEIKKGKATIPTNFRFNSSIKEGHKQAIYCISWSADQYKRAEDENNNNDNNNDNDSDKTDSSYYQLMGTCGGKYVTIYEVKDKLEVRYSFVDGDEEEEFWACAFGWKSCASYNSSSTCHDSSNYSATERERPDLWNGPQLLCVGGKSGILKVIDPVRQCRVMTFVGHGGDIYDIQFSPVEPQLCLTASVDTSIRLWNLASVSCVAMFSGHEGHRATVITTSFHLSGCKFVSAGMDHVIKLWSLPQDRLVDSKKNKTTHVQLPFFSTQKVHTDYIDCVQFIGDCILSKSVNNSLILWKPILQEHNKKRCVSGDILPIRVFTITNCEIWFLRFQTNPNCSLLALGNSVGNVNVWYLDPNDATIAKHRSKPLCTLTHNLCSSVVRMVSFAPDGKSLVYCCDDATVWKFNAVF